MGITSARSQTDPAQSARADKQMQRRCSASLGGRDLMDGSVPGFDEVLHGSCSDPLKAEAIYVVPTVCMRGYVVL